MMVCKHSLEMTYALCEIILPVVHVNLLSFSRSVITVYKSLFMVYLSGYFLQIPQSYTPGDLLPQKILNIKRKQASSGFHPRQERQEKG